MEKIAEILDIESSSLLNDDKIVINIRKHVTKNVSKNVYGTQNATIQTYNFVNEVKNLNNRLEKIEEKFVVLEQKMDGSGKKIGEDLKINNVLVQ